MSKEEFKNYLEKIYQKYRNMVRIPKLYSSYNEKEIEELTKFVIKNYKKDDIRIYVYEYEEKKGKIILKTDIGSFLLDRKDISSATLRKKYCNTSYDLFTFFKILSHNDLLYNIQNDVLLKIDSTTNYDIFYYVITMLEFYLQSYFTYRMIQDPLRAKQLFINHNKEIALNGSKRSIPLEYLDNPDFNHYWITEKDYAFELKQIYDNFYQFDKNIKLVFTMLIMTDDSTKLNYIKEHLQEFKEFIIDDSTRDNNYGEHINKAYEFLKKYNLIYLFSEEELMKMYKKKPNYYLTKDEKIFLPIASKIKNTSPTIRLDNQSNTIVHVKYYDYELYDGILIETMRKSKFDNQDNWKFFDYVIYYNNLISKLYQKYYRRYQKMIQGNELKDNLYEFLKCIFQPKTLVDIYNDPYFDTWDLNEILGLADHFGDAAKNNVTVTRKILRQENLRIYNEFVMYSKDSSKLKECIEHNHLSEENIYSYIINNKFLYAKEKNGLLNIVNLYYGKSLKVLDILLLLDEMLTREMTIDEILKVHELSKKDFNTIYSNAKENNPILYQYIFEALSKNKRRGYIKILRLGYKVLNTPLSSLEEYNQSFASVIEFSELIKVAKGTELEPKLQDKARLWKDYNEKLVKKRTQQ